LKKRKNSRLLVRKKRMKKILSNIGLLLGVTGKVELNHQGNLMRPPTSLVLGSFLDPQCQRTILLPTLTYVPELQPVSQFPFRLM
jgi:hypothetical protein